MNGSRIWWMLVICAIVVAGYPRVEATQANFVERTDESLSQPIGELLVTSGATELNLIQRGQRKSGYQFRYQGCNEPMRVVVFSVRLVAESFVDHYAKDSDHYTFQHLDFEHDGSSRFKLTTIWAWNKVKNALQLSPFRGSSKQIVIVWPNHCDAPDIDWSLAWRHSVTGT